jgi:hypothetical protein
MTEASWHLSHRADSRARSLADRHYNRQKIGSRQFAPPGRCVVLVTRQADAFWITSWPFAEYAKHEWPGAWVCSAFRNEGSQKSSALISEAVAVTRHQLGEPPAVGMVTFVDPAAVRTPKPALRWCYRKAGFQHVGQTKGGLHALRLLPCDMSEPLEPRPFIAADGTFQTPLAWAGSAAESRRKTQQTSPGAGSEVS